MNRFRLWMGSRRERGAVALIVSMCMVILLAASALGMDIAKLAYERQALRAAVDAGAQAGSYALGESARAAALGKTTSQLAIAEAKSFADSSAPDLRLSDATRNVWDIRVFCTVGLKAGTLSTADPAQIAATCPGMSTSATATGCNTAMCAVPCPDTAKCNTIKVSVTRTVDFMFGPAINIPTGSTGAVSSAACRGTCGGFSPNPLNVVVLADRTGSMSSSDLTAMEGGIKTMLTTMTQSQQYVAFGMIHASDTTQTCKSKAASGISGDKFKGSWLSTSFDNNYNLSTTSAPGRYNPNTTTSPVYNAVDCFNTSSSGTHLAAPLKSAARYLLGLDANNIAALDSSGTRSTLGTPAKVIIFETDGAPNEDNETGIPKLAVDLTPTSDISTSDASQACTNLVTIANAAKAQGIRIITIGFGGANTETCGSKNVRDVLAQVADGAGKTAPRCDQGTNAAVENADGDNYYCGGESADLTSVFATAMGSVSGNTRLILIPNVSN